MSNKLKKLMAGCKCSVSVTVNDHKDYYLSVMDSLLSDFDLPSMDWQGRNNTDLTQSLISEMDVSHDVLKGMVDMDSIVCIQFYPDAPVGFHRVYHYDLDKALDEALRILN